MHQQFLPCARDDSPMGRSLYSANLNRRGLPAAKLIAARPE